MKKLAALLIVAGLAGPASAQISADKVAQMIGKVSAAAGLAPAPAAATVAPGASGASAASSPAAGSAVRYAVAADNPTVNPKVKKLWRERRLAPKPKTGAVGRKSSFR